MFSVHSAWNSNTGIRYSILNTRILVNIQYSCNNIRRFTLIQYVLIYTIINTRILYSMIRRFNYFLSDCVQRQRIKHAGIYRDKRCMVPLRFLFKSYACPGLNAGSYFPVG